MQEGGRDVGHSGKHCLRQIASIVHIVILAVQHRGRVTIIRMQRVTKFRTIMKMLKPFRQWIWYASSCAVRCFAILAQQILPVGAALTFSCPKSDSRCDS